MKKNNHSNGINKHNSKHGSEKQLQSACINGESCALTVTVPSHLSLLPKDVDLRWDKTEGHREKLSYYAEHSIHNMIDTSSDPPVLHPWRATKTNRTL